MYRKATVLALIALVIRLAGVAIAVLLEEEPVALSRILIAAANVLFTAGSVLWIRDKENPNLFMFEMY